MNTLQGANTDKIIRIELPGGIEMNFCFCPAGKFMMGSPEDEKGRGYFEEQMQVRISKPFLMEQTPCTQEQWRALGVDAYDSDRFRTDEDKEEKKNLPIMLPKWGAQDFITKLNTTISVPDGWKFAPPTEAQWEYACRAGTTGSFAGPLDEICWHSGNSDSRWNSCCPVGRKVSNGWGLHDMHGNVEEWVAGKSCLEHPGGTDPFAGSGYCGVMRGGSCKSAADGCRSASREYDGLNDWSRGFRVALVSSR